MKIKRLSLSVVIVVVLAMACFACTGPAGPQGPPGTNAAATCVDCHNSSTTIVAKDLEWHNSVHFTGGDYVRATSAGCAGCHSSDGFTSMIAANQNPGEVTTGDAEPTPPNCRTCHNIHATYTSADWALTTTAPVTLYVSGKSFNFGQGNLCANCHQPRTAGPTVGGGDVQVTSTHWGPHHGPQTASFLGVGGYNVSETVSIHYQVVQNGCPTCHMGANADHEMTPVVAACTPCHSGATNFDINGVQTEVQAKMDELADLLTAKGLLNNGSPVVGTYPEADAGALWNLICAEEDRSVGVHNPVYINALLDEGIAALK